MTGNDMQALGVFSQPSYLTIGDKYEREHSPTKEGDKKETLRHTGKQFITNPPKKGKVGTNCCFEEFRPLYQNEKFVDPGTAEKEYAKELKKKNVVPKPFVPSSPTKRSPGLGTYYGTIGAKFEHQMEYEVQKKGDKPKPIEHEKRNFVTSPGKKGTYGVPHTTLGSAHQYMEDPFDTRQKNEIKENAENIKKRIGQPFKSTVHSLDFFNSHKNVAAPRILSIDEKVLPPKKEKPEEKTEKKVEKPFKPSSPPKKGFNCTINPFPEYKSEATEPKSESPKGDTKEAKNRPVFKPVSNAKSSPTRSIIFHSMM